MTQTSKKHLLYKQRTFVTLFITVALACLSLCVFARCSREEDIDILSNRGRAIQQNLVGYANRDDISWERLSTLYELFQQGTENSFTTSSDYFKAMVESRFFPVDYSWFSGAGVRPANSTKPALFGKENNAWAAVVSFDNIMDERSPFLITRNLYITNFSDIAHVHLQDIKPFGKRGFLVITRGGCAVFHKKFDPDALFITGLTNTVLRP